MEATLESIKRYLRELEPKLATMSQDGIKFAILGDSDGDSCLFNGLLSTVWDGNNWPLVAVLMSQGEDGMWYRSPRRRACKNDGFNGLIFSRDMATGVMAAATHGGFPYQWWSSWVNYIDRSRPCLVKKPKWLGGGCALRSPVYYYAPEVQITPACWAMMGRVASFRGWPKHSEMQNWEKSDGDVAVIEAQNCEAGYQLHLKAVDAFIKLLINQSREYSQKVGKICYNRVPDNLFYRFLASRTIDAEFCKLYCDMAPAIGSEFKHHWVWEKSSVSESLPFSCGWDFVFLGKLILRYFGHTA